MALLQFGTMLSGIYEKIWASAGSNFIALSLAALALALIFLFFFGRRRL